jgi:hypothetical protein
MLVARRTFGIVGGMRNEFLHLVFNLSDGRVKKVQAMSY